MYKEMLTTYNDGMNFLCVQIKMISRMMRRYIETPK